LDRHWESWNKENKSRNLVVDEERIGLCHRFGSALTVFLSDLIVCNRKDIQPIKTSATWDQFEEEN